MPTADDPRITVRLYPALKAALDARAARTGRSVGSIVTEACESLLAADVPELRGVPVPEAAARRVSPRAPERTCPLTPQQLVGRSNGGLTLARATELVERGGWEAYVA